MNEKKSLVKSFSGETVLRGDDFKRYVNSLRGKSNTYKKRRAEISDIKAEIGVLSRTVEVLHSRQSALERPALWMSARSSFFNLKIPSQHK